MEFGDVLFVAAFIILPLLIIVLSVVALRALNRRPRYRDRVLTGDVEETTAEFQLPPRDWAESVQPTRGQRATRPVDESPEATNAVTNREFRVPAYRARSGGIVRRLGTAPPRGIRPNARSSRARASEQPTETLPTTAAEPAAPVEDEPPATPPQE
jgi:hypothetical protein